tara:strand:+ start:1555 stop:2094 length:540 start_codon:yes stop_codon:yes gene_type:complete
LNLAEFFKIVNADLKNHGASSFLKVVLCLLFNMSFRLVLNYRIGYFLAQNRRIKVLNILILYLRKRQVKLFSSDISYNASIGKNIKFPHPISIVIGENSLIGNNVMIWQGVTLGSHGKKKNENKEYPTINDNVRLYTGCVLIGGITVGENSIIGANTLLNNSVESNSTVVGGASRILNK